VGLIQERFTTAGDGRLTGMYLDWEFVIDGGDFDGARLVGRTGSALAPNSRAWAWTEAALGSSIPRYGRFDSSALRGRRVMLEVIRQTRPDGDGVMNVIAAVMRA
jgi:hypothetical protein